MKKELFLIILMALLTVGVHAEEGFSIQGTQLLDATGKPFVIAGINNPHAWAGERAYQALGDIAATGANTVRIVWQTRGHATELERIIQRCIALKMIPMVELHDVTGNSSGERLLDIACYYVRDDVKAVLMRHQRYLLINIANEWGDHQVTAAHWSDSYSKAVTLLRENGIVTTLVIDAPGWGQNINPILEGGRQLIDADPLHNILFSVHMYGSWNDPQIIVGKLTTAKEKQLPLIVGEFGYNYNNGQNNLGCKADHRTILRTCHQLGYGFIPWSWTGNNRENAWLNMVDSRDWKTPTQWGREVIDGEYGIRQTARSASVFGSEETALPRLVNTHGHYTLMVDGLPFMMMGGQCGNSSNWPAMLPQVWQTMEEMNANMLEIPIYWEEVEKVRGQYDFTSVQRLLDQARQHQLRLVLLWFGTWKNGSNHYMPEWMKLDYKKYFSVLNKEGKAVDSPSPFAREAMDLDAQAFKAMMQYLKDHDPQHTVIMVQVENEAGCWGSVRDYSPIAEKVFRQPVPEELLKNKTAMHELETIGTKGSWSEVFGPRADEYFHAWHVASYIEYVAEAGKSVNPLPLYTNAALRNPISNPMANEYESGGPTDNVICIYKVAAPSLDLVAPDIYLGGDEQYMAVLNLYSRPNNALMVPETHGSVKYLYEVLRRGIGFAPFGVDHGRGNSALAAEFKLLKPLTHLLPQWTQEGRVYSAYEPDKGEKEQVIDLGEWEARLQFGSGGRSNGQHSGLGKAMIVKMGEGDFLCMGTEVRFSFRPAGKNKGRAWHFLRVEEGSYSPKGEWVMTRVLNGDQTDWGGPHIGNTPGMLRIKVYARDKITD